METIKYLNEFGLDKLQQELGIKVSQNENYPDLYVLNYDQIKSPKSHPIVIECRSLVVRLEGDEYFVESRSFDRFFNYGEIESDIDITKLTAHEKVDGSLIGYWYSDKYGWLYRTRSMIMPVGQGIMGHKITWGELIERNMDHVDATLLAKGVTYILELVSKYNRVVTKYDGERLYLLAERVNSTGEYVTVSNQWVKPKSYSFDSINHCIQAARELDNLEEGYVLYNELGKPAVKVKSPAYVAAHRLRGESTPNPKRIMDLIIENEQDEYLSIFPEDMELFRPYIEAYKKGLLTAYSIYEEFGVISDQKEFALKVKDYHFAGMLFAMRSKELTAFEAFSNLTTQGKYRFIEGFIQ